MITASGWRPRLSGTLQGFLDLELEPSGIVLRGCTLHEKAAKRWIALPAKPQTNTDGSPRIDPKTGKALWTPIFEIPDKAARDRFQAAALQAVDKLLGRGSAP